LIVAIEFSSEIGWRPYSTKLLREKAALDTV